MGYAFTDLIAPAILFLHPGITREQFVDYLSKTHCSEFPPYEEKDPWDIHPNDKYPRYHGGLEELAEILFLKKTRKYKEFQEPRTDENGLRVCAPVKSNYNQGVFQEFRPNIRVHIKNILEKPKRVTEYSFEKLKDGDFWSDVYGFSSAKVLKIFSERELKNKEPHSEESFPDEDCDPKWQYDMEISEISSEWHQESFETLERLYRAWPQFHPNFIFDWSQQKGVIYSGLFGKNNWLWKMIGGKYFLDEETFNKIPATMYRDDDRREGYPLLGYVDLIMTAEAIKNKAWKLLSYRGQVHTEQFLRDFPNSLKQYKNAVEIAHLSLAAKSVGMSNSDFLRMRALWQPHKLSRSKRNPYKPKTLS